jgi:hypothetical protein
MQAVASPAIELPTKRRRRTNRLERATGTGATPAIVLLPEGQSDAVVDVSKDVAGIEDVIPRDRSELISRAFNVSLGLLAVICLAPVLVLIALAVRLTSKGPIFYSQWVSIVATTRSPPTTGVATITVASRS